MQVDAQLLPLPGLRQRQAAILLRGLCVPTVPHGPSGTAGLLQLPPLLQVVQVGFGACVSWRKRQTERFICGIWRRKQPNLPGRAEHPPFPACHTIHSRRKVNPKNPALAAPLDTSRPNCQGSEEAPKPPQEEVREGKILVLSKQRLLQVVTPNKSAASLPREEGMCFPRGGTLQAAGEVVQLPAPHGELPGSFVGLDPCTAALGIS